MRILVTGGAGFIGSHVVDALIKKGHAVVVVDNLSTGSKKNLNSKAKFYKLDIQSAQLGKVFKTEKPRVVFHYAAQIDVRKSVADPVADAKVNITGTLNVLENCRKFGVEKIIFTSTGGAIYGDAKIVPTPEDYPALPLSPYGIAKLSVEHYLHYYSNVFGIPFVVLRLANVYGPRQNSKGEAGVVAIFAGAMIAGKQPVIYGTGKQTRDFVFVGDVVSASMLALSGKGTGVFNVGTAKETTVNEIFTLLEDGIGRNFKSLHRPARKGEQARSCLSHKKIRREMGWKPKTQLKNGIEQTITFFQTNSSHE